MAATSRTAGPGVKDRIHVAKGRFLISSSIRKIGFRHNRIFLEDKIFQSWLGVKLEAGYEGPNVRDLVAH